MILIRYIEFCIFLFLHMMGGSQEKENKLSCLFLQNTNPVMKIELSLHHLNPLTSQSFNLPIPSHWSRDSMHKFWGSTAQFIKPSEYFMFLRKHVCILYNFLSCTFIEHIMSVFMSLILSFNLSYIGISVQYVILWMHRHFTSFRCWLFR
jgi:hypothetical protein